MDGDIFHWQSTYHIVQITKIKDSIINNLSPDNKRQYSNNGVPLQTYIMNADWLISYYYYILQYV